ncbi:hypothetical protein MMPV_002363 [Pyropia vietnamensis]
MAMGVGVACATVDAVDFLSSPRALYERVQFTPSALPRLYLLVTAGAVYARAAGAPVAAVLRDLVHMAGAVQHPQRGLFLRAYLAQSMRDRLPNAPAGEEEEAAEAAAAEEEAAAAIAARRRRRVRRRRRRRRRAARGGGGGENGWGGGGTEGADDPAWHSSSSAGDSDGGAGFSTATDDDEEDSSGDSGGEERHAGGVADGGAPRAAWERSPPGSHGGRGGQVRSLARASYPADGSGAESPTGGSPTRAAGAPPPPPPGGTVRDSIDFLLANFTEMNRLWVRMAHDTPPRERAARAAERRELRLLVGSNVATLSRLSGLTPALYRRVVLPGLASQVVACGDTLAQSYLADCIVQVFPDEFHIASLGDTLSMLRSLVVGADVAGVLVGLLTRLARYAAAIDGEEGAAAAAVARLSRARAFRVLLVGVPPVLADHAAGVPAAAAVRVAGGLMRLALAAHKEQLNKADAVLRLAAAALSSRVVPPEGAAGDGGRRDDEGGDSDSAGEPRSDLDGGGSDGVERGRRDAAADARRRRRASLEHHQGGGGGGGGVGGNGGSPGASVTEGGGVSAGTEAGGGLLPAPRVAVAPGSPTEAAIEELLTLPLNAHRSVAAALALPHWADVAAVLPSAARRRVAAAVLATAADSLGPCVASRAQLEALFRLIGPLVDAVPSEVPPVTISSRLLVHFPAPPPPPPQPGGAAASAMRRRRRRGGDAGDGDGNWSGGEEDSRGGSAAAGATTAAASAAIASGGDDADGVGGGDRWETSAGDDDDPEAAAAERAEARRLLARLPYLLDTAGDLRMGVALLRDLHTRLGGGGRPGAAATLPPLVWAALRSAVSAARGGDPATAATAADVADDAIGDVAREAPELGVRLALAAAAAASVGVDAARRRAAVEGEADVDGAAADAAADAAAAVDADPNAPEGGRDAGPVAAATASVYDAFARAWALYEGDVVAGSAQYTALTAIVRATRGVGVAALPPGGYAALAGRAVKHAGALLSRADQCLALCAAADLYWAPDVAGAAAAADVTAAAAAVAAAAAAASGGVDARSSRRSGGDGRGGAAAGGVDAAGSGGGAPSPDADPAAVCNVLDRAAAAAQRAPATGERALLLLDVAAKAVALAAAGCPAAVGGRRVGRLLRDVKRLLPPPSAAGGGDGVGDSADDGPRGVGAGRTLPRHSPIAAAAAARLGRLVGWVRGAGGRRLPRDILAEA